MCNFMFTWKKWTIKFKLLYLRNYVSYFTRSCRISCVNTCIQNVKVWLKSILPRLKYSIFCRGLFVIGAPCTSSIQYVRRYLKNHLFGIWEITAQCDAWYPALYKYSYLLTYLLTYNRHTGAYHLNDFYKIFGLIMITSAAMRAAQSVVYDRGGAIMRGDTLHRWWWNLAWKSEP